MRYPIDTGRRVRKTKGLSVRAGIKAGGIDPVNYNRQALAVRA